MSPSIVRVPVKRELLEWAIERSGRRDDVRKKFLHLDDWLEGSRNPTFNQLKDFAQATYTPIGFLFSDEVPRELDRIPEDIVDFRIRSGEGSRKPSVNLLDTLTTCRLRQDWYREEMIRLNTVPLELIGQYQMQSANFKKVADITRNELGFDIAARSKLSNHSEALRNFVQQVEDLGILVMRSGIVSNNTRRKLDPGEFQGFALSDRLAPLIFINSANTKAAQIFTLAHELAHLWIGKTSISSDSEIFVNDNPIETWCNEVAAEFLLPSELVSENFNTFVEGNDVDKKIKRLARYCFVSRLAIIVRLHKLNLLSHEQFLHFFGKEITRLGETRQESASAGGDYYRSVLVRCSYRFSRTLIESTLAGQTSFTKFQRLLDVTGESALERIAEHL